MNKNIIKKTTVRIVLILLMALVMLFPVSKAAYAGNSDESAYVSRIYNERNSLPTGEANDVLQTSDGYMWIGSYGGLIRYDGTNFRNFSMEDMLPSSSVRMMYEDSDGCLWIGTNDAGVFTYKDQAITRPEGQPEQSFLCVRGFVESPDGIIYACSNSGIAEIKDNKMFVYNNPEIEDQTFYSLAIDRFGRIWGADNNGGIKVLKHGEIVHSYTGEDIFGEELSVYSITSGTDGSIWVGSNSNAIAKLNVTNESFGQDDVKIIRQKTGNVSTHNNLRMMADGTLLISGQWGLGLIYPDGSFYEFEQSSGADSVNSAYMDYEGNIWLASSSKGIVRFSKGCYASPNLKTELEGTALNTISIHDEITYVGTDNGLIIFDKDWNRLENKLTDFYTKDSNIRIKNIISDHNGNIWIAAYDGVKTVVRYNPKNEEIKTFSPENGLISDRARVLLELSDGNIAVGTQNGLNIISNGEVTKSYTNFSSPVILCLLEGENGSLLIGSDGSGIYELKDDILTSHAFEEGLGEGVILRMKKDLEGNGYFISAGSSLYYWENNSFRKFENIKKEPGSIFDFYQTEGILWLFQNNGILSCNRNDIMNDGTGNPITYSFAHGLTGSLNANTWHYIVNDRIYLATRNGISILNYSTPEYCVPKGIINSVTIDDIVYEHPDTLKIPSDAKRITIDFAVLSYTDTTPISVTYQLQGFEDTKDLDNGKSGQISYTNLPGGSYTFEFHIIDDNNTQNESIITLAVEKDRKFTEQPLFWIIVVIILIAVVVAIVLAFSGAKINNAKKRQQEYREILEQSLMTFAGAIDAKDTYTNGHSIRVAQYSRELARRLDMSTEQQEHIYYVALLHDIGKIGIPDHILNKPGHLTDEEFAIIKTHPNIGAEILKSFTALDGIAEGAKYHHERFDGTGYSEGRAGMDIPLFARIICVADAYDAMSSRRCYRKSMGKDSIISELEKGSGTQFDPSIVIHMISMIKEEMVPFT